MSRSQDRPWREGLRLYGIQQGRADLTIRAYVYDVALVERWLLEREPHQRLQGARQTDVLAWLADYRGRASQASVVRRLSSLRFFYRWLHATGQRSDDPTEGIHLQHPRPVPKRPFSRDELRDILAACRRPQDRALVLLLIDTGLRRSELMGLRREDADLDRGLLRVRGKGGKERMMALGQQSLAALRLCLDGLDGRDGPGSARAYPWYSQRTHGPLTPDGLYRLCRRLSARSGIAVWPHRFRTTWACMFLEASEGDVGSAQVLMGHAKIETTLHYASWTKQARALEQQRRLSLADRL